MPGRFKTMPTRQPTQKTVAMSPGQRAIASMLPGRPLNQVGASLCEGLLSRSVQVAVRMKAEEADSTPEKSDAWIVRPGGVIEATNRRCDPTAYASPTVASLPIIPRLITLSRHCSLSLSTLALLLHRDINRAPGHAEAPRFGDLVLTVSTRHTQERTHSAKALGTARPKRGVGRRVTANY